MSAIAGPSDGPVAVTGASGYIGAHVLKNLVEHGYDVHACLRDTQREDKTSYLSEIAERGPGSIRLFACDLYRATEGEYDEAFGGCSAVFHVAADIGTDSTHYGSPSAHRQYESLVNSTLGILSSCRSSGSVKRLVYTSSAAAVCGPLDAGVSRDHIFDEDDWAGGRYETLAERYTGRDGKSRWEIETASYAKGKVDAEKEGYKFGEETGIEVMSVCPVHVLGPLLGRPHDTVWQHRISLMLKGESDVERRGAFSWNIIDVRDIAETQRLMVESSVAGNGTRYLMSATDESGEPTSNELFHTLRDLFPSHNICGGFVPQSTDRRLRVRCTKAINELGLQTHSVRDTLLATGTSLIDLGVVPAEVA